MRGSACGLEEGLSPLKLESEVLEGHLACYVGASIQTLVLMMAQVCLAPSLPSSSHAYTLSFGCY